MRPFPVPLAERQVKRRRIASPPCCATIRCLRATFPFSNRQSSYLSIKRICQTLRENPSGKRFPLPNLTDVKVQRVGPDRRCEILGSTYRICSYANLHETVISRSCCRRNTGNQRREAGGLQAGKGMPGNTDATSRAASEETKRGAGQPANPNAHRGDVDQ